MSQAIHIPAEVSTEISAAKALSERARTYPVPQTHDEYIAAAEELKVIKGKTKWLEEAHSKLKAPILAAGRAIDDFFRPPRTALADAETSIKGVLKVYDERQEMIRRDAERKAAEAARREQERLRAEAAKAEEAARVAREREEAKARAAREREEAKARELEEAGRAEEAERRRQAAAEAEEQRLRDAEEAEARRLRQAEAARAAAAAVPSDTVVAVGSPKVGGISTRTTWSAELDDLDALIAAAAGGNKTARGLLAFDKSAANKLASALKENFVVPGVRAVATKSVASRSA